MAFEDRHGRSYYYRKKRCGNRVISEYIGCGKIAELTAYFAEAEREEQHSARQIERKKREKYQQTEQDLTEIEEKIHLILESFLISHGFYCTKSREWRKKRNGKSSSE